MSPPIEARVIGVLLAGGQSRRMGGGDKSLKMLGGQPMLARIIERVRPQVAGIIINANGDVARFDAFNLPVVPDPIGGFAGPLVGVLAGLRWLEMSSHTDIDAIITVPTDAPFLPQDIARRLVNARGGKPDRIVLAASGGRTQPVCGLWPASLANDLEAALLDGTRKVLDWTDRHDVVITSFAALKTNGEEIDPFFNTNRPEELAEAEALIARHKNI
jgi:molybdopterin-guanine dinucleotide biosynthesis protein A